MGRNDTVFPVEDTQTLLQDLEEALTRKELTPLQRAQYSIQLKWLQGGLVPETEIITQSSGLIAPAPNTNYLSMISGLMVRRLFLHCVAIAHLILASSQQGNDC